MMRVGSAKGAAGDEAGGDVEADDGFRGLDDVAAVADEATPSDEEEGAIDIKGGVVGNSGVVGVASSNDRLAGSAIGNDEIEVESIDDNANPGSPSSRSVRAPSSRSRCLGDMKS